MTEGERKGGKKKKERGKWLKFRRGQTAMVSGLILAEPEYIGDCPGLKMVLKIRVSLLSQ